jgi:hypothetical protein
MGDQLLLCIASIVQPGFFVVDEGYLHKVVLDYTGDIVDSIDPCALVVFVQR